RQTRSRCCGKVSQPCHAPDRRFPISRRERRPSVPLTAWSGDPRRTGSRPSVRLTAGARGPRPQGARGGCIREANMSIRLHSAAFSEGAAIPRRHTGDGEDLSPPLSWEGLPPATRELAMIVDDPDAPTSEPWVHWVIYNLPATQEGLIEGVPPIPRPKPLGPVQGKNSWGSLGYRGPAPPKGHGVHRYIFRLYALDRALELPEGLDKPGLLKAMRGHILAEAELI